VSWEIYTQTLLKLAKEWERGLMVAEEYAERVLFVTAEYVNTAST
jgi:hypothetical protein